MYNSAHSTCPEVSILLAVRNEEKNLEACLQSIAAATAYSKRSVEVLIGDDASTDNSYYIALRLASVLHGFRVCRVPQNRQQNGKAAVLTWLAQQAKGSCFLFTDADMILPKTWVNTMTEALDTPSTGIVTGFTVVSGLGWLAQIQAADWLCTLSLVHLASGWQWPLTAMGNNMGMRTETYHNIGGFEAIPPSPTEDLAIFRAAIAKGWGFRQLAQPTVLGITKPLNSLSELFGQRKRWFAGAMLHLPLAARMVMLIHGLWLLVWFALFTLGYVQIALSLVAVRALFLGSLHYIYSVRLQLPARWWWAVLQDWFFAFFNLAIFLSYLYRRNIYWKDRVYEI